MLSMNFRAGHYLEEMENWSILFQENLPDPLSISRIFRKTFRDTVCYRKNTKLKDQQFCYGLDLSLLPQVRIHIRPVCVFTWTLVASKWVWAEMSMLKPHSNSPWAHRLPFRHLHRVSKCIHGNMLQILMVKKNPDKTGILTVIRSLSTFNRMQVAGTFMCSPSCPHFEPAQVQEIAWMGASLRWSQQALLFIFN